MPEKMGAEALIKQADFEGKQTVIKERIKKNYRIEELDKKLRSQRTRSESRITGEARRVGVRTPMIFLTDEKNNKIYFEQIEGKTLKDHINSNPGKIQKISQEWGEMVGKLHSAGIVHEDLTTSNAIVSKDNLYLIDFGLSFFSNRDEDKAEDINLLRQSVQATHNKFSDKIWNYFIKGYLKYNKNQDILKRADEIAGRGRYVSKRKSS